MIDLRHHGDAELAPGLVDLAVNVRTDAPPVWLRTVLHAALDDSAGYPDARPARAAVAAAHGRDPSEVLLTAGAAETFVLLARALEPRHALVVHPSFTEPEAALLAAGYPVTRHLLRSETGYRLTPDTVPDDADLVVLGNPTNPTSVLHPAAEVAALARPGRVLVVDEAFADTVPGELESLAGRSDLPGLLVVRSLTKTWGLAGLRVGYALGPPPLIAQLAAAQPHWPVSTPALAALIACCSPAARAEADDAARSLEHWRAALLAELPPCVDVVAEPRSSFVLLHVPDGLRVRKALRCRGWAVRRGDTFPGLSTDHIRVAVRDPETSRAFAAALAEVLSAHGVRRRGPHHRGDPMNSAPAHVGLPLRNRRVVVVGGGQGAHRAVAALLDGGATVHLVSPAVTTALEALATSGSLTWQPRRYEPGDLADAWYAVAATDDPAVNKAIATEAECARILCSVTGDSVVTDASAGVGHDRGDVEERGVDESRPTRGGVVLVGGGPGDPELITVRGMRALWNADVVIADHLAPQALLAGLRPEVEVIDAAKLPRGRAMPQEQINALLVSHARAGKQVVRLKGGDPFVFGRGMEEVEACTAAGIPVEVVPGVSSAIGVPGLAGIPVTHRGLTHEFVVVSGHLPPGHPDSLVDWPALGRLRGTVVVLMGVHTAATISAALIQHGRSPDTPVAVIADGATGRQRRVVTTLVELPRTVVERGIRPPAVWVVGDVVGLHADSRSDGTR